MWEVFHGIVNLLTSVGAGVIANYISVNVGKWLDSWSAGNKKH